MPTWLHFPSHNPSKSSRKSIPRCIKFLIDFGINFFINFCSIWEANLELCWPHFPPKWGGRIGGIPLFCWIYVIFRFGGPPGPLLTPSGLDFGRFGARFWRFLVPIFSFLINVCEFKFSIKLALCAIILFLDLDGLVGLREAQRIDTSSNDQYH